MKFLARLAAGVLTGVCLLVLPAAAQEAIYRCGNEYTQRPCEGARQIRTAPPASEDEREAARLTHWRQSLLAEELAGERQRQEREARGGPAGIRGRAGAAEPQEPQEPQEPSARERKRSARERGVESRRGDTFRAVVPKTPRRAPKS